MYKIAKSFYLSLVLTIAFFTTEVCAACTTDCCKNCDQVEYYCLMACGSVAGCKVGCSFNKLFCQSRCSTNYWIRNSSLATMNFFDSEGTKLETLGPLAIKTFYPKAEDFPITVTDCENPKVKGCEGKEHQYDIEEKGCYFTWYYRATPFLCFTSQPAPPHKSNVKRPVPAPSKSKETKNQSKKVVAPSTSTSSPKRKEAPREKR